ncbi:polyprenol monophosphomannose synthase [Nocardioides mangrovicus]|uniref:Polyprenol monophosphomannose synthase n=1 Tax=Nocardioides mangrovicus TaxID=2478913 RepID=A0A3L8P2A2_9ACTN|nr:polyprenol monophosphomannose synthase [Nocardioides mangrovicus]
MTENPAQTLVVIPTYNEIDNLRPIVQRTLSATSADVLVVDDASPDGTGELADRLAAELAPRVHVLHRTGKQGLGAAYLHAFSWALNRGYDAVVEMDADGSHSPEQLPRLLRRLDTADVVLGSRWIAEGGVVDWPLSRRLLSRGGNWYVRRALGLDVHDATGGFRAYRAQALRAVDLTGVASHGYCFQVDLVRRALVAGMRVAEVPITFRERQYGTSKMSGSIVREALWRVTVWGAASRLGRRTPSDLVGLPAARPVREAPRAA